jgi:hypothetical protein
MTIIGYARASMTDQDLSIQLQALKAAGCDVVRKEKASGASPDISRLVGASGRRISESSCATTTSRRFEERPDADRV